MKGSLLIKTKERWFKDFRDRHFLLKKVLNLPFVKSGFVVDHENAIDPERFDIVTEIECESSEKMMYNIYRDVFGLGDIKETKLRVTEQ